MDNRRNRAKTIAYCSGTSHWHHRVQPNELIRPTASIRTLLGLHCERESADISPSDVRTKADLGNILACFRTASTAFGSWSRCIDTPSIPCSASSLDSGAPAGNMCLCSDTKRTTDASKKQTLHGQMILSLTKMRTTSRQRDDEQRCAHDISCILAEKCQGCIDVHVVWPIYEMYERMQRR